MEPDAAFLDTLEDLRRRTDLRASEYDMVQAAGLVRRLVLDKNPLWVVANRRFSLKPECIWYRLRVRTPAEGGGAWVPWLWFDPALAELKMSGVSVPPPSRAPIGKFMDHEAILRDSERVTVRELVTHYANREGGVHLDSRPPDSKLLGDLRDRSDEALRLTIVAIGRIIWRALDPLAIRVVLDGKPHPAGFAFGPEANPPA